MDALLDIGYAPTEDAAKQHGVALDELYVKWDIKLYEELFWMLQLANECGFDTPEEFATTRDYSCFRFWWDDHWQLFAYKKIEAKPEITSGMSIEELKQAIADAESDEQAYAPVINNKFDLSHYNFETDTESDRIYKPVTANGVKFDRTQDNYDFENDLQGFMPTWSRGTRMRAAYGLQAYYQSCEQWKVIEPKIDDLVKNNPDMSNKDQVIHVNQIVRDAVGLKFKLDNAQIASNLGCFINNSSFSDDEIFDYLRFKKMKTKADRNVYDTEGVSERDSEHLYGDSAHDKKKKKDAARTANKPDEFAELKEKFKDLERNDRITKSVTQETNNVRNWKNQCIDYIYGICDAEFKFPIRVTGPNKFKLKDASRKAFTAQATKNLIERGRTSLLSHGSPLHWFENAYADFVKSGVQPITPTYKFPFYISCYGFRGSTQATVVLTFKDYFQSADNEQKNEIMTQWWDALIGLGYHYAVDLEETDKVRNNEESMAAAAVAYACLLMRILVRYAEQGNEIDTSKKMPIEVVYDEAAFEMLPHIVNVMLDKSLTN